MKRPAMAAVLLVAASTTVASAGGFVQSLPEDGSWVKYAVETKSEVGPQAGNGTMMLRSVGTATENGEKCRWIEVEFNGEQNGRKQRTILKFLAPEKDLKAGAKGPTQVLRGWQKSRFGDTERETKPLSEEEKSSNGPIAMFLGGKQAKPATVKEAKTIDYQKGRLKIESAESRELNLKPGGPDAPPDYKFAATQTVWKHKGVPFGTAAMRLQVEVRRKDKVIQKMTMTFEVLNHGKDAKSALPEKN